MPSEPLRSKLAISYRFDSAVALACGTICVLNGESIEAGELAMSNHAYSDAAIFLGVIGEGDLGSNGVLDRGDGAVLIELTDSRIPNRPGWGEELIPDAASAAGAVENRIPI